MANTEVVYGTDGRRDWSILTAKYLLEQYQQGETLGYEEEMRLIGEFIAKSKDARNIYGKPAIIPYGGLESKSKSENLRVFKPENANGQVAIVIGGGYWRVPSILKDETNIEDEGDAWNDFPALGLLPHGVTVINIDYPVLPEARMADTVASLQKAISHIYTHAGELGIDKDKLNLIGHSAGGQLAALMVTLDIEGVPAEAIKSVTSVSGVPDIGFAANPNCHLRQGKGAITITESDTENSSATYRTPKTEGKYAFLTGAEEPFEFQWQSQRAAEQWASRGADSHYEPVEQTNHYTLFGQLADSTSFLTRYVLEQMGVPMQA